MRKPQQPHHAAACGGFGKRTLQSIPAAAIFAAREELVAIDKVCQRVGLGTQAVDHVPIIDYVVMTAPSAIGRPPAWQGLDGLPGQIKVDPVIEDPGSQAMADEPGRHGVEDLAQHEAAR
ncbi:hypothetical protein [Sphingomonas yabuuchiae]|jgi:hypothetical protein|uniref:hypothetical protein n=1 Tax=Sphingomonas yabuuchiae TaxID=172044 RepID=UPI00338908D3